MRRAGQVELFAVIGAIVVVVVVIALSLRGDLPSLTLPSALSVEEQAAKAAFSGVLANGVSSVLDEMEARGGYLSLASALDLPGASVPPYTTYLGEGVPYWQVCQNSLARSAAAVTKDFEFALANYLKAHLPADPVPGKQVDADASRLSVDVKILDSRIEATMTVPTTISGRKAASAYAATVPTQFGTILSFAQDAAKDLATYREFDENTITAIYLVAKAEDGHDAIPTGGILTKCGDGFTRSPEQLGKALDDVVQYVLVNTNWFVPESGDTGVPKTFAIPDVNGKKFALSVQQRLPDGLSFVANRPAASYASHKILNNPTLESLGFGIPECHGAYIYAPSFSYPYIIEVQDALTKNAFRFAGYASIQKMQAASCSAPEQAPVTQLCANLACEAGVRVVDGLGSPVPGAVVSFGACFAGTTNANGVLGGSVPCGAGTLSVSHPGYVPLTAAVSGSSLAAYTATLAKAVPHTISFRSVSVSPGGAYTTCSVSPVSGPARLSVDTAGGTATIYNIDQTACLQATSPACQSCQQQLAAGGGPGGADCASCASSCISYASSVTAPSSQYPAALPSGTHPVRGELLGGGAFGSGVLSGFQATGTIPQAPDPLAVSIPAAGAAGTQAALDLKNSCGIEAFRAGPPYAPAVYRFNQACSCASLGEIAAKLQAGGCAIDLSQFAAGCPVPAAKAALDACGAQVTGAC